MQPSLRDQMPLQGRLALAEGAFEPVGRRADPTDLPAVGLALVVGELPRTQLRNARRRIIHHVGVSGPLAATGRQAGRTTLWMIESPP
ncbi:hypothetical protein [Streptomyces sp. NRRL B-2790]|uniref:hypothetical protein n=1 Tax=Streptomyces sp. NRRL B-2790 TaxID=1463835 RepID=UPI000A4B5BA4